MANPSVNDMSDPARRELTVQSAYQTERLLQVLLNAANNDDSETLPLLLCGILPRLMDLNGVVMSAAGDSSEDFVSLESRFRGGYKAS